MEGGKDGTDNCTGIYACEPTAAASSFPCASLPSNERPLILEI